MVDKRENIEGRRFLRLQQIVSFWATFQEGSPALHQVFIGKYRRQISGRTLVYLIANSQKPDPLSYMHFGHDCTELHVLELETINNVLTCKNMVSQN